MKTEKTKYLSCAETARLVREALKQVFPTTKFSVRSKTYSGGASITVHWQDGPTDIVVRRVAETFEGATFDCMTDYKGGRNHTLNGQPVSFGSDFIFCERHYSPGFLKKGIKTLLDGEMKYGFIERAEVKKDDIKIIESEYGSYLNGPHIFLQDMGGPPLWLDNWLMREIRVMADVLPAGESETANGVELVSTF